MPRAAGVPAAPPAQAATAASDAPTAHAATAACDATTAQAASAASDATAPNSFGDACPAVAYAHTKLVSSCGLKACSRLFSAVSATASNSSGAIHSSVPFRAVILSLTARDSPKSPT